VSALVDAFVAGACWAIWKRSGETLCALEKSVAREAAPKELAIRRIVEVGEICGQYDHDHECNLPAGHAPYEHRYTYKDGSYISWSR